MFKLYIISLLSSFLIFSCASTTTMAHLNKSYNNDWIRSVKGKKVVAPNGYLYHFEDNGNVEYKLFGKTVGRGIFVYADSSTNAYYYEDISLKRVASDVKGLYNYNSTNVSMYLAFILDNNNIKMTSGYTKDYYTRLSNWKKSNLTLSGFVREGSDLSDYPIPYISEVDFNKTIEFGKLR